MFAKDKALTVVLGQAQTIARLEIELQTARQERDVWQAAAQQMTTQAQQHAQQAVAARAQRQ